jgi:hypothetical protein
MVQPQCAAPSAEPELQIIHGDWMQSRGPQGLLTLGWITPVKGVITKRCPLAGLKADLVANQGSVREKAILGNGVVHVCFHPKDPNDATKGVCGWTWSTPVKPTKSQTKRLGINVNLAFADDVSFESSHIRLHIKTKRSAASSHGDRCLTSAFITGTSAALTSPSADSESTVQSTSAAVISSPSAESTVQSSSQQQQNTTKTLRVLRIRKRGSRRPQ